MIPYLCTCTHRPLLLPLEWFSEIVEFWSKKWQRFYDWEKQIKLDHLEEVKVVTKFP